jgi:hypothetical protein
MISRSDRSHEGRSDNGPLVGIVVAMIVVMAAITFTLHKSSPLIVTGPGSTSEPSTTGQADVAPARSRSGIER